MNSLYLFFSLGGVALMVALCALLFGLRSARFTSTQGAEVYLTQILPTFRARSIALGADRKTALVENDLDGTIHLVVAHGDTFVARKLSKAVLRDVTRDGTDLLLHLADFTLPQAKLALGDCATAAIWLTKLAGANP